jgi:hypothetical protein
LNDANVSSAASLLRQLFGDNRAEWTAGRLRDFFVSPTYLQKLESVRPCFLVGGRGTGKTTALQSLRFDSCLERLEVAGLGFDEQFYLGLLVRMNKNRVRAFQGPQLPEAQWSKYFAHYFNLLVCLELVSLAEWLQPRVAQSLAVQAIEALANELGLPTARSLAELRERIQAGISQLQLQVNNPARDFQIVLSMPEAPIRAFATALQNSGLLEERTVFCCVDEYENLLDTQQAVLNTYIKHAEPPLSYKIGVRKNGLRNRQTLDGQDLLKAPDDYAEIEISEEGFEPFAQAVAELRLKRAQQQGAAVPTSLDEFLENLSFAEEARLLGAERVADAVLATLESKSPDLHSYFKDKPKTQTYFLKYWLESESTGSLVELAVNWRENETEWETRLGNYGFASLFWLSRGNKGARIRKYYCGRRVLLALAGGNIRYFLELIDTAIGHEFDAVSQPVQREMITLPAKAQTLAARDVGQRRLNQLEGLADHGVQLKRLVLAVGKVFFELARTPHGRTPEVTSFVLSGSESDRARLHELLSEGVAHLAFEVAPRTKPTSSVELRDDEFRLHRIFCAFFEISHRKKRRMTFQAGDLLSVLDDKPSKGISALLDNRAQATEDELPEQLAFFSAFYGSDR